MKVLVVESNPILLKIISLKLSRANYTVYSSLDGENAQRIITHIQPDIIITKLRLKYISGLELIKLSKSKFPNVFIIVMTKIDHAASINDFKKAGVNVCIKRPFNLEALIQIITEYKLKQEAEIAALNLPETIPLYKNLIQLYKDGTHPL
ncbi:response regulator [Hydrotalea sp.]|uniref:response regulator n=1 Tax=Hydrotalea sp. TaxID=2881279 RepID=UPI00262CEE92|nr:response regulator [Hydrotalea sp.]